MTWLAEHWDSLMTILNTFGLLFVANAKKKI